MAVYEKGKEYIDGLQAMVQGRTEMTTQEYIDSYLLWYTSENGAAEDQGAYEGSKVAMGAFIDVAAELGIAVIGLPPGVEAALGVTSEGIKTYGREFEKAIDAGADEETAKQYAAASTTLSAIKGGLSEFLSGGYLKSLDNLTSSQKLLIDETKTFVGSAGEDLVQQLLYKEFIDPNAQINAGSSLAIGAIDVAESLAEALIDHATRTPDGEFGITVNEDQRGLLGSTGKDNNLQNPTANDAGKIKPLGEEGNEVSYKRPTRRRTRMRTIAWQSAMDENGVVKDPATGRVMDPNEPWDMGHKPGYEFWKHQKSARERGISRKQFLDEYNNPLHYRPELPSSNRRHLGEDKTPRYLGP